MTKKITPETLKKKVDEYFNECGNAVFPDYAGMLLSLGLFEDEVAELCDGESEAADKYRRVFDYAKLKRKSWAVREAANDSKRGSILFNLLKQEENGGYTSASAPNKGAVLSIKWDSAGGAEAFK
jgi:hypothetical protein